MGFRAPQIKQQCFNWKIYTVVKTLITGSVRGQTLEQTLEFMRNNVINKNKCYLPETIKLCYEMNDYTIKFYDELIKGIL